MALRRKKIAPTRTPTHDDIVETLGNEVAPEVLEMLHGIGNDSERQRALQLLKKQQDILSRRVATNLKETNRLSSFTFAQWPFTMFHLDLRSLALCRILAALWVLINLWWTWNEIPTWLTDQGFFPRKNIMKRYNADGLLNDKLSTIRLSSTPFLIHLMGGNTAQMQMLFVVHVVCAVMMLLGYYTTTSTILTWVMQRSLNARAPWMINKGSELIVLLLAWFMVLPLGRAWSLDSWRRNNSLRSHLHETSATTNDTQVDDDSNNNKLALSRSDHSQSEPCDRGGDGGGVRGHGGVRDGGNGGGGVRDRDDGGVRDRGGGGGGGHTYVSLATVGMCLQAIAVYIITGYQKTAVEWKEGWAAHAAVLKHHFARDNFFAYFLRQNPVLFDNVSFLYLASFATVFLEIYGVWGLLGPSYSRLAIIVALTGMQLTFGMSLHVYLFFFSSTIMVLPMTPSLLWDEILPDTIRYCERRGDDIARVACVILGIHTTPQLHPRRVRPLPKWLASTLVFRDLCIKWTMHLVWIVSVGGLFVPMVASTLEQLKIIEAIPKPIYKYGLLYGSTQRWPMFTPGVGLKNTRIFLPGVLEDGTAVDAWPVLEYDAYPTQDDVLKASIWDMDVYNKDAFSRWPTSNWLHFFKLSKKTSQDEKCPQLADYVCKVWNKKFKQTPGKKLMAFKIVLASQQVRKGDCLGCALKQVGFTPKVIWQKGCVKDIIKPNATVHPSTLAEIRAKGFNLTKGKKT